MAKRLEPNLEKVKELETLVKDCEEKWKRALADYQNLEKRTREEKGKLIKYAGEEILVKLLPFLDNLEKAAGHLKDEGLDLAVRQLWQVLANEGLAKIITVGEMFNPQEMEAVDTVLGDEENKVRHEFRSGYKLNGRIIRVAQVQVEKKKIKKNTEELAKTQLQKGEYM